MGLKYFIAGLAVMLFLTWGMIYFQNSSIEKVSARNGSIDILEIIDTNGGSFFVLADTGDFLTGEIYEKGLLGWKVKGISQALNDRKNETVIRPDNIGYVSNGDIGFYYGYADAGKVEAVKLTSGGKEMSSKVNAYYWVIPVASDINNGSFFANQFSAVLKDGTEVFYPFTEIN
ncbi:hypothetical protein MM300_18650 [Evansella sp. LMS18]|jgi:hypothetical protein|uniref:hypothetical protein n=1 Tax=Evansella sp. LMS18 TaxID=2924033 RepID=UPI0020D16BCF|nr:hypothetical protein [Evansella sp. LMS18]UTR09882.1 hypothetical protein MM300_18650 [Evansella sp. LMS18]